MPQLQTLRMQGCDGNRYAAALTAALLASLPHLSGLTELDIGFPLAVEGEQPAGGLPGLHLLPALRVLRCSEVANTQLSPALAHSIALAPALEELHISYAHFAPAFFQHLEERCRGADGGPPVALRRLRIEAVSGVTLELRMLALLPHLERLVCPIHPSGIAALAACRRLRSLSLTRHSWSDAHYRELAELQLPHLEELALTAVAQDVTVTDGLCHLLQLPALTRLRLPPLPVDSLRLLRLLADGAGRRALRIDEIRFVSEVTFPLFEQ